ncbi:MAG TPA: inositol monophosphatase [Bryobacteraceae bacterium]|nr:inositol monophosphatase [Bryobacteraceae bacterium]
MQHLPSPLVDINDAVFLYELLAECRSLASTYSGAANVTTKSDGSLLTELDEILASTIQARITSEYPRDGFLSEENTDFTRADRLWIVDPLDGTTNYSRDLPIYCVSIALAVGDEITLGGILLPALNRSFIAARGRGAYAGNTKLKVSQRTKLDFGSIVTFCSWRSNDAGIIELPSNVRAFGSTAYHLTLVASGATEGTIELGCRVWDFAAGSLLVTEAGGFMEAERPLPNVLSSGTFDLMRFFAAANESQLIELRAAVRH